MSDAEALSGSASRIGRIDYSSTRPPQFQLNVLRSGIDDRKAQPDIVASVSQEIHDDEVAYERK
jgi:hypothetical protein